MVSIISGTNRVPSNTYSIVKEIEKLYIDLNKDVKILDLSKLPLSALLEKNSYSLAHSMPIEIRKAFENMEQSKLIHLVFPEYQGSLPGVLKFFIDHLGESIPRKLPVFSLVSLGGRFGGIQALDHLLRILTNLGIFVHPQTISLSFSGEQLQTGVILNSKDQKRIKEQIKEVLHFSEHIKNLKYKNHLA